MNKSLVIAALLSFLIASPALAATFSTGNTYTLDKQTTISDDLYAAAGSPIVSGTILGDTMLTGGNITFDGSTKNNLMVAGGTLTLLGSVGSSIRAMGGTITISGPVGSDVVAAGGTISILQTATIARDVAIAGGNIQVDGIVGRNVTIRGGSVTINGTVNGNVDVQASKSFALGAHAVIKGTITYSAPSQLTKAPGASVVGAITYNAPVAKDTNAAGFFAAFFGILFIIKVLAYGTAIVLATTIFHRTTSTIALSSVEDFWKNLCIGFVALILIPIICVVLLISILGSAIAFMALFVYLTLVVAAKILTAIIAGAFLSKWYRKEATVTWKWSLLGLVALELLALVPIIGWVAGSMLFLAAMGTVTSLAYYAIANAR